MNTLYVYFDAHCPFCLRCRDWLAREPAYVRLRLVAADSPEAWDRLGAVPGMGDQLVVADERGRFWVGAAAFIVCLWALRRTRSLALTLSHPWLAPLARVAFDALSAHRGWLSALIAGERCQGGCRRSPGAAYR